MLQSSVEAREEPAARSAFKELLFVKNGQDLAGGLDKSASPQRPEVFDVLIDSLKYMSWPI